MNFFRKILNCTHEFSGKDLKQRDGNGVVKWACRKCGKVFTAKCGLDILANGKCIGGWGIIE